MQTAYFGAYFIMARPAALLMQRRSYKFGILLGLCLYASGALLLVPATLISSFAEQQRGISSSHASYLLSMGMLAFLVGRFSGSALMNRVAPRRLLTVYAVVNVVLCVAAAAECGSISVAALIAIFFFMSIMFPTIFALGVASLGAQSKVAASFLVMSIVGGAIAPYFMGLVADAHGTGLAYLIPCGCFVVVARYGASGSAARPNLHG